MASCLKIRIMRTEMLPCILNLKSILINNGSNVCFVRMFSRTLIMFQQQQYNIYVFSPLRSRLGYQRLQMSLKYARHLTSIAII